MNDDPVVPSSLAVAAADAADAKRWADAEREAAAFDAPDLRPVMKRYVLVELPVAMLLAAGVGLTVIVNGSSAPIASETVFTTAAAIALGLCLWHLFFRRGRGEGVPAALTYEERRGLRSEVLHPKRARGTRLAVLLPRAARATALTIAGQTLASGFLLPAWLFLVGAQLARPGSHWQVWSILGACWIGLMVGNVVRYRRARAFLRRHPSTEGRPES